MDSPFENPKQRSEIILKKDHLRCESCPSSILHHYNLSRKLLCDQIFVCTRHFSCQLFKVCTYSIMRFISARGKSLRLVSFLLYVNSIFGSTFASAALHDTFDYVVVGSGPGGGPLACNLARAGFKTLLLEAGEDESTLVATKALYLASAPGNGERLTWSYWVRHYDDIEMDKKYLHLVWKLVNGDLWVGPTATAPAGAKMLGIQYPRGATLGGSSIVNAGLTLLPANSDWDYIKNITGDTTWK